MNWLKPKRLPANYKGAADSSRYSPLIPFNFLNFRIWVPEKDPDPYFLLMQARKLGDRQ